MSQAEDPPPATVTENEEAEQEEPASHKWLTKMVAERVNATESTCYNSASRHVMPGTISFTTIAELHRLALDLSKTLPTKDYLAQKARSSCTPST